MPAQQQREQHGGVKPQEPDKFNAQIGDQVVLALGRPLGLQAVQVRRLWEGHYRVNIFVGEDISSARVANSYFVRASAEGQILETNPAIVKTNRLPEGSPA